MPEAYTAVPYDHDELSEALLQPTREEEDEKEAVSEKLQEYGFVLGLIIGFLIDCGALTTYIVLMLLWEGYAEQTPFQKFGVSVVWSFLTSVFPFLIWAVVRLALKAQLKKHDATLEHMEFRFGLGSLMGVSLASASMDVALGIHEHMKYSAGLFVVALLCLLFHVHFDNKKTTKVVQTQTDYIQVV